MSSRSQVKGLLRSLAVLSLLLVITNIAHYRDLFSSPTAFPTHDDIAPLVLKDQNATLPLTANSTTNHHFITPSQNAQNISSNPRTANSTKPCPKCHRKMVKPWAHCCHCCTNRILLSHKMGVVLAGTIRKTLFRKKLGLQKISSNENVHYAWWNDTFLAQNLREIVVSRNFVDAIVSGYLYHRSGKECWLTYLGNGMKSEATYEILEGLDRTRDLVANEFSTGKSNICRLIEWAESTKNETVSMEIYMDLALTKWYLPLVKYRDIVKSRNNTMFMCFERLSSKDPSVVSEEMDRMKEWFTVNDDSDDEQYRVPKETVGRFHVNDKFVQAHGSNTSDVQRNDLRRIVQYLDHSVFNGVVSKADSIFNCSKTKGTENEVKKRKQQKHDVKI